MSNRPAIVAHGADKPGALALNAEDDLARSAAIVQAAGYQLIPLRHAIGPWELLCVSPRGLTLVSPVVEKPNLMGGVYSVPAGWPAGTVGLILIWGADPLPKALTLS